MVFKVKYNGIIKSSQKQPIISLMSHLQTQPHLAIHEKAIHEYRIHASYGQCMR